MTTPDQTKPSPKICSTVMSTTGITGKYVISMIIVLVDQEEQSSSMMLFLILDKFLLIPSQKIQNPISDYLVPFCCPLLKFCLISQCRKLMVCRPLYTSPHSSTLRKNQIGKRTWIKMHLTINNYSVSSKDGKTNHPCRRQTVVQTII